MSPCGVVIPYLGICQTPLWECADKAGQWRAGIRGPPKNEQVLYSKRLKDIRQKPDTLVACRSIDAHGQCSWKGTQVIPCFEQCFHFCMGTGFSPLVRCG